MDKVILNNSTTRIYPTNARKDKVNKPITFDYTTLEHTETTILTNKKTGEIVRIDNTAFEESTRTVVYVKPIIKVILQYDGRKFIGVAKCDPEDSFSAQKGFTIANARAVIEKNKYIVERESK